MESPEKTRLTAVLAKVKALKTEEAEHQMTRKIAERDLATALEELKTSYGVESFDAGVALASKLKADYLAQLTKLEEALA